MYCVEALSNELLSGEYEQTIPIIALLMRSLFAGAI